MQHEKREGKKEKQGEKKKTTGEIRRGQKISETLRVTASTAKKKKKKEEGRAHRVWTATLDCLRPGPGSSIRKVSTAHRVAAYARSVLHTAEQHTL
eukprot:2002801-Rhodomonas_salina.1